MEREKYARDAALADMGWRLAAPGIRARRRQFDLFVTPDAGDATWVGPAIETERTRWTPSADTGARPALAAVLLTSISDFARQVPWRGFGVPARRMAGLFALGAAGFGLVMLDAKPGAPGRPPTHHASEAIIADIAPASATPVDARAGGDMAAAGTAGARVSAAESAPAQTSPARPQAAQFASTASDPDASIPPAAAAGSADAPALAQNAGAARETAAVQSQWGASAQGGGAEPGPVRAIRTEALARQPLPQRVAAVALAPVAILTAAETPRGAFDAMPSPTERPRAVPGSGGAHANAPVAANARPLVAHLPGRSVRPAPLLAAALPVWTPMPAAGQPARIARTAEPASRPAFEANRAAMAGWRDAARPAPVLLVRAMAKRPMDHRMAAADFVLPRWLTQPKPAAPHVLVMSPQPHMLQAPAEPPPSPARVAQAVALPPPAPAPHPVARPLYEAPAYANYEPQPARPAYYAYGGYYQQPYHPRYSPQTYYPGYYPQPYYPGYYGN